MNQINFKGVKGGIILDVKNDLDFNNLMNNLEIKSQEKNVLLEHANLIGLNGIDLDYSQKAQLEKILKQLFKINVLSLEKFTYNDSKEKIIKKEVKKVVNETKFIKKTIRSGEEITSEASIVIIGDVNPGAVVKAVGNIIVLGTLRGIAHAGFEGDDEAFITALKLNPNQLRISSCISRSPDNYKYQGEAIPEMAFINDNRIVIEKI